MEEAIRPLSETIRSPFPGAVLLVAHHQEIIFHQSFGAATLIPHFVPMTRDTFFDLASLTKPLVTAATLLTLVQEGKVQLEDPVSKFIPEFSISTKKEVSLFHLLNHSAGLPDRTTYYERLGGDIVSGSPEARAAIYQMAHHEPLIASPGERAVYSDIGFILLGEIVEQVTGERLDCFFNRQSASFVEETTSSLPRFLARDCPPLSLAAAATEDCPWRGRVIQGEVHDENCHSMGGVAGHAGLFGTAEGVYRMVLKWNSSLNGEGPFVQSLAEKFVSRQRGNGVPDGSSWGLGWDTPTQPGSTAGRFFSHLSFGHLGFTGTSVWVDRACHLMVILLTNRIHPHRDNQRIRPFRPILHNLIFQEVIND